MTLIEMIGVLAVLAILAAVLLPALIREADKLAADTESANLQAYSDALQQSIERYRYIPGESDWATNIASQLGVSTYLVATNARHQARIFVIDPALQIGANGGGLPYAQTNFASFPFGSQVTSGGVLVAPVSPRVMIVSSLGASLANLASAVANGTLTANDFSNLWNTADGTVPSGGVWAGWNGQPADVKVQRINLSPLFVHLVLDTYESAQNGYYSLDSAPLASVSTNSVEGYFIQNTVLGLYNGSTSSSLDSQQVLIRDGSFVYDANVWRSSIIGGLLPGGGDLAGVVAQFLAAPPNLVANGLVGTSGNALQQQVVTSFISYMSNYDTWAAEGFPNNSFLTYLQKTVQPTMMTNVQQLYGGGNSSAFYPTSYPCAN